MSHLNDTGYLLHHLASTLDRQSDQILQERLGIGFSQLKVMMVLRAHGGVRQRFIADHLGQTEASISRQVGFMKEDGLLEVKVSPANRREHLVSLTRKGTRLMDEAFKILNHYHSPVFASLSERQRMQLHELVEIMHREICRQERPGGCHKSFIE